MPRPASQQPSVSRRAFLSGVFAAGAAGLLAGCGSTSEVVETEDATEEDSPVVLNVGVCDLESIDPFGCTDSSSGMVVPQLFDPLTRYDFPSGTLVGLAAESWDVSDDATTFTFHLVSEATFHDGEAVTSASFKRAWKRLICPDDELVEALGSSNVGRHLALVKGYDEFVAGEADDLAGVSCPDDETLEVELSISYADFPYVVAHPALAPVPSCAVTDPEGFLVAPVGNGPFMLAEGETWAEGQSLTLVRFDGYHGGPALVDEVEFLAVNDIDASYREFESGDVDVTEVPIDALSDAKKDCGLSEDGCTFSDDERLTIGAEPATTFIVCNTALIPLNNLDVRRGLSLAIDRESICDDVYRGTRLPADGIVSSAVLGYQEGAWGFAAYDEELAAEYLEQVYPADEEGMRDLSFTLMYSADGGHDELAEAIVDDLAKIGVTVETDPIERETLVERYAEGDFTLGLMTWTADYPTLDNVLYPLFHSDSLGGYNRSGYSSEDVDTAIDEARAVVDDAARTAALQEVDVLVGKSLPVIPLMYNTHQIAASDRVDFLYCDPMGRLDLVSAEVEE